MDHILILEDDPGIRRSLVRHLTERGCYEVTAVGTLREALLSLDRRPPQLVITDLELPDGSGVDLLPELALRQLTVPVIVITGHIDRFQAQLPAGPHIAVVTKPFDPASLLNMVARRLEELRIEPAPTSAFSVADYLQLAGMARRSVILEISQAGSPVGQISVVDGAPSAARDRHGEGESAFRRLALLQACTIACRPLNGPVSRANLSGSLERLLIDAARESDEANRTQASQLNPSPAPSIEIQLTSQVPPPKPPRLPPRPPTPVVSNVNQTILQEKSVNVKLPAINLDSIVGGDLAIDAVARAERDGSVLEISGQIDAETACAVALMAGREINEAASELGFSRPLGFHIATAEATWFVLHRRDELIVAKGPASKNPTSSLRKLSKACGV
jgi:CheY-like chemotaxis protein